MDDLSKFGKFIVQNLRDRAIEQHLMMQSGRFRGARAQALQSRLATMKPEDRETVRELMEDAIDTALHDLLFALQDSHDRSLGIEVLVNGENVAERSGALQSEPLGDEGWIARFSRFATRAH